MQLKIKMLQRIKYFKNLNHPIKSFKAKAFEKLGVRRESVIFKIIFCALERNLRIKFKYKFIISKYNLLLFNSH